jgi:hypothetical protein
MVIVTKRIRKRTNNALKKDLRPQITAHIDRETRDWLDRYAKSFKLSASELLRLLIRRERKVGWLKSAFSLPDADARLIIGGSQKSLPQSDRARRARGR